MLPVLLRPCTVGNTHWLDPGRVSATSPSAWRAKATTFNSRAMTSPAGATFYTTGMEHSATSTTVTGWEPTPWHEALKKTSL